MIHQPVPAQEAISRTARGKWRNLTRPAQFGGETKQSSMVIPAADDPALSVPVEIRPARREVTQLIQVDPESPAFDRCIEPHGVRFPGIPSALCDCCSRSSNAVLPLSRHPSDIWLRNRRDTGAWAPLACAGALQTDAIIGAIRRVCSGNGFDNAGHVHSPSADRPG